MKKIKQKIHTKCALKWPPVGINLDTLHTAPKAPISVVKIENVIFGMHFVFAIKYVYLLAIKYVTKHLTSRICLSTVIFDNCNFEKHLRFEAKNCVEPRWENKFMTKIMLRNSWNGCHQVNQDWMRAIL